MAVGCAASVVCGVTALGAINTLGAAGAYTTSAVLVAGSGGALAWTVSAPVQDPEISPAVHGNSLLSTKPAYLYQLYGQNGEYLKTGITSDPARRYSQAFMSDKFMEIINVGSRSNMVELERKIVEVDPGPLNFERWAGVGR